MFCPFPASSFTASSSYTWPQPAATKRTQNLFKQVVGEVYLHIVPCISHHYEKGMLVFAPFHKKNSSWK